MSLHHQPDDGALSDRLAEHLLFSNAVDPELLTREELRQVLGAVRYQLDDLLDVLDQEEHPQFDPREDMEEDDPGGGDINDEPHDPEIDCCDLERCGEQDIQSEPHDEEPDLERDGSEEPSLGSLDTRMNQTRWGVGSNCDEEEDGARLRRAKRVRYTESPESVAQKADQQLRARLDCRRKRLGVPLTGGLHG